MSLDYSSLSASALVQSNDFIVRRGGHFYKGNSTQPYYFIGTNMWYGPILGSTSIGGNRQRLLEELDMLQKLGITNIRILVGADAGTINSPSVEPCLQPFPGQYEESLLEGLDFILVEMGKRRMYAVVYLTNSWDWSGGYGFYLKNTGHGDSPDAHGDGWSDYVDYARNFFHDEDAQQLYWNHIKNIVTRVNSITGKAYKDDATIMSWQLCNEPRPFGKVEEPAFIEWVQKSATLIKSLDNRHLVSTGSEGVIGCNVDYDLCREIHSISEVDYITVHIWPVNWRWANPARIYESLLSVYSRCNSYIAQHEKLSSELQKPYVIEEFGYPRDENSYVPGSSTNARDQFYKFIFSHVLQSSHQRGTLGGCNFWGWGGVGRPHNNLWSLGADYICDPPHEPQGWYSVFSNDSSTLKVIENFAL